MSSNELNDTIVSQEFGLGRQNNGIVFVLLSDLYRGNLLQIKEREYKLKNLDNIFSTIQFRGHIVDCMIRKEKHYIVVDDATECIECIFSKNIKKDELNEYIKRTAKNPVLHQYAECDSLQPAERQAVNLCVKMLKSKLKSIPQPTVFKIGDYVEVIADLVDFERRPLVFINSIIKLDPTDLDGTIAYYRNLISNNL